MLIPWIVFAVFLFYFAICESIWAMTRLKQTRRAMANGTQSRLKLYRTTMLSLWIPASVVLALPFFTTYSLENMGIKGILLHEDSWFAWPVVLLSCLYACYLVYQIIVLRHCARNELTVNVKIPDDVSIILPETKMEKRMYVFVSLTAAVTEEVLFRGYLLYALGSLFPGLHWVLALAVSSCLFGLVHQYMGWRQTLKTALVGAILGVVYIASGSLLPGMLLHFLQDFAAVDLKTVRAKKIQGE